MPYTLQDEVVLCGGNFWHAQALFMGLSGVTSATAGYAGGTTAHPTYHDIGDHVEAVHVVYDQRLISFTDLLSVFSKTVKTAAAEHRISYRILYMSEEQRRHARQFVKGLSAEEASHIVVEPLGRFWPAEDYHQNYLAKLRGDT